MKIAVNKKKSKNLDTVESSTLEGLYKFKCVNS